ncbi:MAG TPA: glycosyltransferase family 4 protein [Stellaceae bacterium]|nr:glycosyltransferase family 4 protein [Stellaceae bacterium]
MVARVAILHHGYIPHYRVRLYELLAERGRVEYTVFHGAPPSWVGVDEITGPFAFRERRVRNREIRIGPSTLLYQPVIWEILTGGYDGVVIAIEAKFIANMLLAPLAKLRGMTVLFWGFGYHPARGFNDSDKAHPWFLAGLNRFKNALTRLGDGYIAYTGQGAARLAETGFPPDHTFYVQNTIDMQEQFRLHEQVVADDPQEIRRSLGLRPDSVVLASISRLVQFKRIDQLIDVVQRINRNRLAARPVELLIVGSGPLEAELKAQAADTPEIHFLGALPPDERVARCLRVSVAAVVCGIVGLLANHALAHGRPVITRELDSHSPELEYIEPGQNGLIVPGDLDAFATELARVADSPEWQKQLAEGALRSREALRMETMAERFDNAVATTLARRRARGRLQPNAS